MSIPAPSDPYFERRRVMVEVQLRARGIRDPRVLAAMLKLPRHEFVPEPLRGEAYEDYPVPIGAGQTISQPYIVASMLEALQIDPADKALEVGTGSGYVTALLAELAAQVISVERHESLAVRARDFLSSLGYTNVEIIVGDGTHGFAPSAPYDVIIVSAAAFQVPPPLIQQLREGGRMIIPVGTEDAQQLQLIRIENGEGKISLREPCRFVPLIGG
jgi:protein-L-isoaspartate(D-aspartate) O-methyltransferase